MNFHEWLEIREACGPACDWVGNRTPAHAWRECEVGEWLAWFVDKAGLLPENIQRHISADLAEHVIHIYARYAPGDMRVCMEIKASRDFADGKINEDDLSLASRAARSARESGAAWAAWAALGAAGAAWAAGAARAAWAAESDGAAESKWQADHIRTYLPELPENWDRRGT